MDTLLSPSTALTAPPSLLVIVTMLPHIAQLPVAGKMSGRFVAARSFASPGCDAVIVQAPAPVMLTAAAAMVQLPLAPKLTTSPDEAVALAVNVGSPKVLAASAPNVIVWSAFAIVNVCGT